MIIIKGETDFQKPVIDLTGPDGNIFVILGQAKILSKIYGIDFDEVMKRMTTSGSYGSAIAIFDEYFGDYVDLLIRGEEK